MQKSMDGDAIEEAIDFTLRKAVDEEEEISMIITKEVEVHKQDDEIEIVENPEKIYVAENGLFMLPKDHPDHLTLIKLQLENQVSFKAFCYTMFHAFTIQELMNWKQQLQSRINAERAECVKLKKALDAQNLSQVTSNCENPPNMSAEDSEYERLVEHYLKENALLEQKRILLSKEIVDENLSLIQLQVELAMKQLIH